MEKLNASKLNDIAEKWEQMKKSKVESNPIDISNFIPNLDDMIKEDCVIDVLKDIAKDIKKVTNANTEDDYKDVNFYASEPFTTTPGYYEDKRAMVLRVKDVIKDNSEWELNTTDGDTYSFKLSDLDIGEGFTFNGNEYVDFTEYVTKMNLIEDEKEKRDKITLRTVGIDTAEIPHFDIALISNPSLEIEHFTLEEVSKLETRKNTVFAYLPYNINKNGKNFENWSVTERDKSVKIPFYKVAKDGTTTYFEIREEMEASKYMTKEDMNGNIAKVIVGSEKPWGSETVIDGFRAQQRVKEIICSENKISDMILILDASTVTPTKLSSNYTPYSSLWYLPDTIKYIIDTWGRNTKIPLQRLTYSPFGTDKYGRFLGTLFVKLKTSEGFTWIDLSKYVLAGTKNTIPNPDFNGSPELQKIKDGVNTEAFDLNSYNRNGIKYVDSLDASGVESYNKMIALHKEITGIDIEEKNECTMMIGDCLFLIPPQSIRNISQVDYSKIPVLRGKGTMSKNQANREQLLEIDIFFYGENGINGIPYENTFNNKKKSTYYMNGLRALFAQFKTCPFLPINNYYINNVLNIEVVSMVNITVNTVKEFPKLLKATLTLREFNYRIYMPDLPSPIINETTGALKSFEPVFAKCFEWELFRFYYQRCIMHGEKIADYEYNTFEYGKFLYSYKNILQRAKLDSQEIEFYIPDEKWLSSALKVKKDKDRYGQFVEDIVLDDNSKEFLSNVAKINDVVNELNLSTLNDLLKSSYIKVNSIKREDILDDGNYWWTPNITFNDLTKNKELKTKLKNVLQNYCDKISNNYAVRYITVDEEINSLASVVTWTYNIKLDFSNLNQEEKDSILEEIRTLDGGDDSRKYLENDILTIKIKANFGNDKKYSSSKMEKSKELIAISSAYGKDSNSDNDDKNTVEEETFNYANYQDPKAMRFVPYLTDKNNESIPIHLDEIAISTSNTFTEMYLKAQDGFAPQFMGGSDITIEIKILTKDELIIGCLNQLPSYVIQTTKTYRRILPCCPLKVKNDYLQMVGVNEVLIDNIDINMVDGFPGLYDIRIKMTSVDRTMRQQEALRKINTDGFTTNIAKSQIKGYFSLNKALAQAELYPDLDLPTLQELSNKGWQYLKYRNEDRIFVDPDFYIVYSFKYTALLFKQIIKEYMYDKFYNKDNDENDTNSSKAFDLYLQDNSGMKMGATLNSTLGLKYSNDNDLAELYDNTIEKISTKAEADSNNKPKNNKSLEDLMEIGTSLNCLTAYGIENGWQIKPGWYASIAEPYINDLVEKLDESGIKRANTTKEDKQNKWVKDLYNTRKDAINIIDTILSKPMKYRNTSKAEEYGTDLLRYAVETVFNNDDGIKLLKLLDPMSNFLQHYSKDESLTKLKSYDPVYTAPFALQSGADICDLREEYISEFYDNANILTFIECFLFASACALSGPYQYEKKSGKEIWFPHQYDFYFNPKDSKKDRPYVNTKNENKHKKIAKNKKDALENGRFFGMFQIGIYSVNDLTKIMSPKSKVDYKQKDMYENSVKNHKRFCEEGFIDPYYNYLGYRSTKGKEYVERITTSAYDNAVAFLRVVLQYLKKMIIDGYFFSEIDIVAKDYESVKEEWSKYIENATASDWGTSSDDDHGGEEKKLKAEARLQAVQEQFGLNIEEFTELINDDIPKSYAKIFCARMIYPFLLAMSENNETVIKQIENRNYDELNLSTLGSNIGSADKTPFNKFLKGLYAIKAIGYDNKISDSSVTSNSQKIFNSMMQEITEEFSNNPKKYVLHSFYDMIKNDKRGRLIRAFPTYYIVFVDEGRKIGTWKLYDNFYNMSSVNSIQIVKSRKNPTDICSFVMTNIYTSYASTYDNTVYQQYVDIYGVKDYFDSIFSPRTYLTKEDMILGRKKLTDTTVLQAGTRVHIRMGYGSNASNLPIVFNGKVSEVECGEIIEVVCQGDGHELCNPLNTLGELEAKSLEEAQEWITILKDIRGSLARGGESPKNLLSKLMTAKYGGLVKNMIRDSFDERFFGDNPFGVYHFGDRRFKDIFEASEIVQNIYEVSNETLLSGYTTLISDKTETCASPTINCSIQDKTMWEIGHMCANAGDDYYFAVRDFGMRSTICLCRGNHYYAYEYFENDDVYYEKRKPFQQYHYYDSYNDIVYNTIKASEKNMKTNAVGTWESTDYLWGTSQSTVGPIFLDMNIYPEYQKSMTVDTGLIASGNGGLKINFATALSERWKLEANDDKVNKSLAEKMTTNVLRQSIKDMYEGELCVIGDPSIKPYDRMDIVDTYEDMSGSVEVETVIFSMNSDTGFTTTIVPDIIAKASDNSQEMAAQNLYGKFTIASGALITGRLGMKKLISTTGIDLSSRILSSKSASALKEILKQSKTITSVIEATSTELMEVLGLSITPVGILATITACSCVYVITRNVKELFYRWMKNIQAISVYPIQKNQRPLIAGMAGHRGSVFGYQYNNPKDSIQDMVMGLINEGEKIPIAGLLVNYFFTGKEYDNLFNYWKDSLGINQVDNDVIDSASYALVQENLLQDIYNSASQEFSSRNASLQLLKTQSRINKFDTEDKTSTVYLQYQIGGIYKEVEDTMKDVESKKYKIYSKLAQEDKQYVKVSDLGKNAKVQALIPVEDDSDIKLAISEGHNVIKSFKFAHSESQLTFQCQFESGDRQIRYMADNTRGDSVFDLPMVQQDSLYVLKTIISQEELKDAIVYFLSGTRINDDRSWKSTGFAFTLSCNDKDALLEAVKKAKKQCVWYGSENDDSKYVFAYKKYDDGVMITLYPPIKKV